MHECVFCRLARQKSRCGLVTALILVAALAGLLLAVQGQAVQAQAPQGVNAPATLTYAVSDPLDNLDPAKAASLEGFDALGQAYETLIVYEPGGTRPLPGLATGWSVSADGLTWTFTLRSGVKFHDGTDFDAAAVAYNFERWWDPAHPAHEDGFSFFDFVFGGFKGDPNSLLSSVTVSGTQQLVLTLSRPYSPMVQSLGIPSFAIASPTAIQAGLFPTVAVGTGPFRMVDWAPNDHLSFTAVPTYWAGPPLLDGVVFQVMPDPDDRLAALQANSVQVARLDWSYVPAIAADPDLKTVWVPALNTGYLGMNTSVEPFDDVRIRQAIAYGIDKPAIVNLEYNIEVPGAQTAKQLLPPAVWGRDETLAGYPQNPTLVRQLLTQAGYPDGLEIDLWVIPVDRAYFYRHDAVARAIQNDLAGVGISVTLVFTDNWSGYLERVRQTGDVGLYMLGWYGDNGHPDNFFSILCDGNTQQFGPPDPVLCADLEAARAVYDMPTLTSMYQMISQYVYNTVPLVPIAHSRGSMMMRANLTGLVPMVVGVQAYNGVFYAQEAVDASALVTIGAGGTLIYERTDTSGVVLEVPAGAVATDSTLTFTDLPTVTQEGDLAFAGQAFRIEVYQNGVPVPSTAALTGPVTLTLIYLSSDTVGFDPATFELLRWDGAAWTAEGITLLERDLANYRLVYRLDHLSDFGLFGQPQVRRYLPVVLRIH